VASRKGLVGGLIGWKREAAGGTGGEGSGIGAGGNGTGAIVMEWFGNRGGRRNSIGQWMGFDFTIGGGGGLVLGRMGGRRVLAQGPAGQPEPTPIFPIDIARRLKRQVLPVLLQRDGAIIQELLVDQPGVEQGGP